ncbi:MAG: peptidoglycan-binding protein [Pseudomonadota bacterium]
MYSKRVPDRVHVVRTPEQTENKPVKSSNAKNSDSDLKKKQTAQLAHFLDQISTKLKRSEAERYELLNELHETKKVIRNLEDQAKENKEALNHLEQNVQDRFKDENDFTARQAKFEKTLKATEDKMVKAIAGQALIDQRLQDTEEKQMIIDQQLEKSRTEYARLDHLIETNLQDKSRLLRKMEKLEEIVGDTQDSLRAKAMVLLTDQSNTSKVAMHAPAWGKGSPDIDGAQEFEKQDAFVFQELFTKQNVSIFAMIVAALSIGWGISQLQQPQTPQIAVLEGGGVARLDLENGRWETVSSENAKATNQENTQAVNNETQSVAVENVPPITTPVTTVTATLPEDVTEFSDEQLLSSFNSNPEELAARLNQIEPGAAEATSEIEPITDELLTVNDLQANTNVNTEVTVEPVVAAVPAPPPPVRQSLPNEDNLNLSVTTPVKNFDQIAYLHNFTTKKQIRDEAPTAPLAERIQPDTNLPAAIKKIEIQAFQGVGEAQHDLAAIYTAGHGGVEQNFEKASAWFWAASENGIANAKYNLGVLNHQGLGKEKSLDKAIYWYREAAKLGHAEAQYNLGIAHIEAIGTNYDPALAAGFFEKAANAGIVEAAYNLGLIFENGLLGKEKPEEALLWYSISAKQGNIEAQGAMEDMAKDLQIGIEDIDRFVERMQQINEAVKGRRAGPDLGNSALSSAQSEQALIAQIQEYLILRGLYSGPADGINGPNTRKAITEYQTANNMQVNGQVSKLLLNHMVSNTL